MLKKRIIFALLYDDGNFVLSRNFRRQIVGNLDWLKRNYDFSSISFYIDELIVLDITKGTKNSKHFLKTLESIAESSFAPISSGGGINSLSDAKNFLNSGADKIIINSLVHKDIQTTENLSIKFGQQCITLSLDIKKIGEKYFIYFENGEKRMGEDIISFLQNLNYNLFGDCYLNSIDRDGTGQGYDLQILKNFPKDWKTPIIMAGGAGNANHFIEGLQEKKIDAVATAHLFNFIGDGLSIARKKVIEQGIDLATWYNLEDFKSILNKQTK